MSPSFRLLHRAILERRQVVCVYRDKRREVCPYILGHKDGEETLLAFQFAGETSGTLPPGGEWRCFKVVELTHIALRSGRWHGSSAHARTQRCVDEVYIDVNTDVTDQPGRR